MHIAIVTPAAAGSTHGNRVTAERWARFLGELGHDTRVLTQWPEDDGNDPASAPDVLIALHARRSHGALMRFRRDHPDRPTVLALTGTDIYQDVPAGDADAIESIRVADRYIVLQAAAINALPADRQDRVHVVYQSLTAPPNLPTPREDRFEVIVIGHLRAVKDPFRAAEAVRDLPSESRLHVVHVGGVIDVGMDERARKEMSANARYDWLGELARAETLRRLAMSRVLGLTSQFEGGANVVSEAIVCGVPVITTRIDGSLGLLGDDYPATFEVGDTAALRDLLLRAERDAAWLAGLRQRVITRQHLFHPDHEREALDALLADLP